MDIERFFEVAKSLVLQAGQMVMSRDLEKEQAIESKIYDWDPVTEYDRKVEMLLIAGLSREFPGHKFIAEETAESMDLTDTPTWLIDPIDGTVNFVHSVPQWCISVALSISKNIVLAIIYNPHHSELYTAKIGEGAFLNDKRIKTSGLTELRAALLACEPGTIKSCFKNRELNGNRMEALIEATQGIRSFGSAALTLAYVARGIVDCFQMDGLKPWDVAAGLLLVREAGGVVLDTEGGPFNFMKPKTLATASKELAKAATELIAKVDGKARKIVD